MPTADELARMTRMDPAQQLSNELARSSISAATPEARAELIKGIGTTGTIKAPAGAEPAPAAPSAGSETSPLVAEAGKLERLPPLDEQTPVSGEIGNDEPTSSAVGSRETEKGAAGDIAPGDPIHQDNNRSAVVAEPSDDGGSLEASGYGVFITVANARLVQALASFGEAPAMMASYQGLNVANDAQASWMSVDALPSIQRMASV